MSLWAYESTSKQMIIFYCCGKNWEQKGACGAEREEGPGGIPSLLTSDFKPDMAWSLFSQPSPFCIGVPETCLSGAAFHLTWPSWWTCLWRFSTHLKESEEVPTFLISRKLWEAAGSLWLASSVRSLEVSVQYYGISLTQFRQDEIVAFTTDLVLNLT